MQISQTLKTKLDTAAKLAVTGDLAPAKAVDLVNRLAKAMPISFVKLMALTNLGKLFIANGTIQPAIKISPAEYFMDVSILLKARTVPELVSQRLDKDYDQTTDLCPSIMSANLMMERVILNALRRCYRIEDCGENSEAENVERWLACYFYQTSDKSYQSVSRQGSSGSFTGQSGYKMLMNYYGQQAMLADTSGELMKIGERRVISGGLNADGAVGSIGYVGTNREPCLPVTTDRSGAIDPDDTLLTP